MRSIHAALVVASNKLVCEHPLIINAKLHLTVAIALGEAYSKIENSIYWKTATACTKKRVKQKLDKIAFNTFTSLLEAGQLLNAYVDEVGQENLPADWPEMMSCLICAYRWIKEEHSSEIYSIQLELNL